MDEILTEYSKSDIYPFHMPGAKRKGLPFSNPYCLDITEIDGFDNLHHAEGILKEAQERAAALYGAKRSFYLVNGSTCGILAAICAAVPKGSKILAARNSHKSVYNALFLWELDAEYIYPVQVECGILGQITPKQVEDALQESPDMKAIIITSPTYEGIVSDIEGIAKTAHRHGIPLIVDEAHGAHFGFHGYFPQNAIGQGADAVIMSLHKTLPSFTQTALLHLCSDRISEKEIEKFLSIYETSSPSYLFMAGMDACIRMLEQEKEILFSEYEKNLSDFYKNVEDFKFLHVMCKKDLKEEEAFDWDASKIVIFSKDARITGKRLHDILLKKYHIQVEMVSAQYVLAMTSIMDTKEGFSRFCIALHEMDAYFYKESMTTKTQNAIIKSSEFYRKNPVKMKLSRAESAVSIEVPLEDADGRVAACTVCLYPPGIPLIVPGEVLSACLIRDIGWCRKSGIIVEGCTDMISVVDET